VKPRHNKKRNTAFLFEVLVKALTQAMMEKNPHRKVFISSLLKEAFAPSTVLGADLECYKTLLETTGLELHVAEKLLQETKIHRQHLNSKRIFDSQTKVINKINKTLSKEAWNTFVPNFKALATVAAIFNTSTPVKQRVLHEDTIIKGMHCPEKLEEAKLVSMDNIIYRSFVEKFNTKYDGLLTEQKVLLGKYISSFADNGLELKLYLSEEIGRLKVGVRESLQLDEVAADVDMTEKTTRVLGILEGFKNAAPTPEVVSQVLNIQQLVREINTP